MNAARLLICALAIISGIHFLYAGSVGKKTSLKSSEESGTIVRVKGKGAGATKSEALKESYRDAIENAVGLYVDSEQMVCNDKVIKDCILTQSNAYIEKYSLVSQNFARGIVTVVILADVRKLALTKKMSEVLPPSALNIGEANQNLHAQIITQDRRNVDSAELLKKGLDGLDPIADVLSVSLASITPVKTYVDGNDSVVRLSYQLEVKVDESAYSKKLVTRLSKALNQISLEMPKSIRLTRDVELSKQADINKKNHPSQPNSGHDAAPVTRRYENDGRLHRDGVDAIEEFSDVYVVKGRIANSDYVLTGLGTFWLNGYRYSSFASMSGKEVRVLRYGFSEVSSGHRSRLMNGKIIVLVIEDVDSAGMNGKAYYVSPASIADAFEWQDGYADRNNGFKVPSVGKPVNRISDIVVSFKDENGNDVIKKTIEVANQDIINSCCLCLEEPNDVMTREDGRLAATYMWYVTPLVSGIAKSYKKWFSIDVNKDDVGRIQSVSFEIQN